MYASISLKEICTTNPVFVSQEAILADVLELMKVKRISSIIVVEGKRPVGIFTERDALRIIPLGLNPQNTIVSELMSTPVVVAPLHLDFFEAYHLCARKNIRHLVVADPEGNLYGIATDTDFMKVLGVDVLSGQEKVENIMSTVAISLAPDASVNEAITLMEEHKLPAIVIVSENKPVGIVTERDLVRLGHAHTNGGTLLSAVMSTPVLSIAPERSIYFAIEMMRERHIRTLAVVNQQGIFLGTLSEHDVVKKIESRYVNVLTTVIKRQADDIDRIRHELNEKHVLSAVLHESLGVGLIVADPAGDVRYMNPVAAKLFGLTSSPATGMKLESLYQATGMPSDNLILAREAAQHGSSFEYDLVHNTGGYDLELHMRFAPIQDQHGTFLGFVLSMQDVTEKNHSERKLKQAASIFENTIEGVIIADSNARILSVNPAFTSITGYEEDEVRGKNARMLASGRQDRAFYERMWHTLSTSGYWQGEIWNRRKSGEAYAEWLTISVIKDADGKLKNYLAVFADITSAKKVHDEFEFLAHHDALTRLPNRLLLNARLSHSLSRAARTGDLIAVMMIDLDGFKLINDQFGHQIGDRVLEMVAERLSTHIRQEDTVSRLGGDEFVVVLEDIESEATAVEVAQKLIHEISRPILLSGKDASLTASVGLAFFPSAGKNPKELLSNADIALYEAKNAGKNVSRTFKA